MYRVLLVDDEDNVLQLLQTTIQWQELGVETPYTAKDGIEALELLQSRSIDILVTDIKMPRLDGINLIRKVKGLYPHIRCILLTAYGEFEYAKEAISLGVENYLLKPVSREEVEQTVRKALDNLYEKRQNGESLLKENILRRWVEGAITEEELSERATVLRLNLYLPEYCVVCLVKKTRDSLGNFGNDCVELLARHSEVYSFWDQKGRYIIIVGGRQLDMDEMVRNMLELVAAYEISGKVGISIGTPVTEVGSLFLSYQMACDSVELSDLSQADIVLHNDYLSQGFDVDYLVEEVRFLFFSEEKQARDNGYKHLGMKLYQAMRKEDLDKMSVRLMGICMRVMVTEFPLREDLQAKVYGIKTKKVKCWCKEDVIAGVVELLQQVQNVFWECFDQYSPVVQLAVKYVQNSVMEGNGGSVKEFCARNGMNPAYLGHIFKKETGIFFNDYLAGCRINRSIILLRNPNKKIKDIAEQVGFASASYYVKCFREIKGVSPTKYRMGIYTA